VLNNYIGLIVPPRLGDNRAHQYGFAAAWLASNLEEPRAGGEPLSKNAIVLPKPLETGLVWTVNQVLPSPDLGRLQTINTVMAHLCYGTCDQVEVSVSELKWTETLTLIFFVVNVGQCPGNKPLECLIENTIYVVLRAGVLDHLMMAP
jgi:hypothetical protein